MGAKIGKPAKIQHPGNSRNKANMVADALFPGVTIDFLLSLPTKKTVS